MNDSVTNSREVKALFLEEMKGVAPLKSDNRAEIDKVAEATPGQEERRKAAVRLRTLDQNYLQAEGVPLLHSADVLAYKKDGVQNGVFRKLRLAQYPLEARLDLHRKTVEEARQEVWQFIRDCMRCELRSVIILHGKGDRNKDQTALLKSYVNHWLKEIPDVLAFHSALTRHGGTGAVYVLLKKSEQEKQMNRERFGSK